MQLLKFIGLWGDEPEPSEAVFACMHTYIRLRMEAGSLAPDESVRIHLTKAVHCLFALASFLSPLEGWNPEMHGNEAGTIEAIEYYEFQKCGPALKKLAMDYFRIGFVVPFLGLIYGNLGVLEIWKTKTLAATKALFSGGLVKYAEEWLEITFSIFTWMPVFVLLNMPDAVNEYLKTVGFTWDKQGFQSIDMFLSAFAGKWPGNNEEGIRISVLLFVFLSASEGAIDTAEVNSWMPSPEAIARMERETPMIRLFCVVDITGLGARAFLKLGREDDAFELARQAVAPEQNTVKKSTLVTCRSIMGQIAARRGQDGEADGHFARALEDAEVSRMPMLELLVARDWKRYALEPTGRDCNEAEAVIDGACEKMNKTRAQLAAVLGS